MGRIFRHRAGRRMFVGVLALAGLARRCIRIPIPCLPGVDIPDCVNFWPPGQETQPPAANAALFDQRCTPLCVLIPLGSPGACEPCRPTRGSARAGRARSCACSMTDDKGRSGGR
jgi:hypothetical protein